MRRTRSPNGAGLRGLKMTPSAPASSRRRSAFDSAWAVITSTRWRGPGVSTNSAARSA
ncbi:MAG TPA: hypothetical protein VFU95_02035 [Telluria sp.]|nr:hypothetical protein [Telluria sp.]